jgi:BirA family biotin operon repressor/biotin-[acetyl-CoA-carboxylase] ligase
LKSEIIKLLKKGDNAFISGQDISKRLGVTRSAIWKYVNSIRDDGYEIESVSNKGYRLISSPDILTLEEIEPYLKTNFIGRNIIHFNSIESTNSIAKKLGDSSEVSGSIVIAEEQTNGRGRLGRSWISPKHKGIWMSILLKPDLNPIDAVNLTQTAAAAIVKATEELGIKTLVKWPNDIVINNKKVSGILTEMNAELTRINYVVVGLGINVNIDEWEFPEDIKDTATSLKTYTNSSINRQELTAKILNSFEELYTKFIDENNIQASINICRENSAVIGKDIIIINGEKNIEAHVLDIDNRGRLLVEYTNGRQEYIISGEVSIRGKANYI